MSASTLSGGSNWLTVSPTGGSTDASSLSVPLVEVGVNPAGLAPGDYYGQVRVTAPAADNSPQAVSIVLNVLPPGSDPGPVVRPTGLIFTGVVGGSSPGSQVVSISDLTGNPKSYVSGRLTTDRDNWFTNLPTSDTVRPNQPARIVVQADSKGLSAGIRRSFLTLGFDDGSSRVVNLLLVLFSGATTSQKLASIAQANCVPARLLPVFTLLGDQFNVAAAWPISIETRVVDDCGNPMTAGSVVATFSNGDPTLELVPLKDGRWSGTWQVRNTRASQVTITVTADIPGANIKGTAQIAGAVRANPNSPQVAAGAVVSAASFAPQVPVAPGSIVSIFGTKLSEGSGSSEMLPLATQLAGTSVTIVDRPLPLLFVSESQINAMIPYDIPVNTRHQLVVKRGRPTRCRSRLR